MAKRVFKDGDRVVVKKSGREGMVVGYRKGHKYPYKVRTSAGHVYCSYKGLRKPGCVGFVYGVTVIQTKEIRKDNSVMGTIRQAIKSLTKSTEQKLFEKYGITDDKDNLTDLGRRVVMDKLFEDSDLRAAVFADVKAVDDEANKKAKK